MSLSTMLRLSALFSMMMIQISCHGNMVYPPVFQDFQNIGLNLNRAYKGHGGFIGCGRNDPSNGVDNSCVLQWYSNFTRVPAGQPMTLPEDMRAFKIWQVDRRSGLNPWYAPGTAHVFTPCGAAGGNPEGCPRGHLKKNNCPGGGHSLGPAAEKYYSKRTVPVTAWPQGSVQNVAFTLSANHGGGYQYRICKVPISGRGGVTEECFQKTPLNFHGSNHRIAYNADESTWKSIPARDTKVGTKPAGSTWRRNPIPACEGGGGGFFSDNSCPRGTQFPAPSPGLHGFSLTQSDVHFDRVFKFAVVDQVEVPEDLEPGEYVLSWRWDNEQTPQIWNTCSSIKVTKSEKSDGSDSGSGDDGEKCAFRRESNIAYYNGDLLDGRENLVDSADICEKQCSSRADCIGFSYVPNNPAFGEFSRSCWLKNNLSDKREGEGVISGVRSKCDEDNGEGSDDSDDEKEKCAFRRESNIAYYNGDLLDGRENLVDSADICEKQCSSRADCIGFSYVPNNPAFGEFSRSCWLKNNLSDKREGEGVISGVRSKCDEDNGEGSDDSDDEKEKCAFRRESNIAYYNGDLLDGRENLVDSADICEKQCSSRADCIGFSYVPNNPAFGEFSRSCWLKNNLSDKREGEGVISGVRSKCDEDNGEGSDDSDDEKEKCAFRRESNIAYYNGDLLDGRENLVDSAEICEKQCSSRADCIGFSYVPNNPAFGEFSRSCWLKNNLSDKREGEGVISGVRSKCDESDGEGSDDSDDETEKCAFRRESNIAYYNGDLLDGRKNLVDSADICEKQCSSRADCIGFSYVPNNPAFGEFSRSCWLKNNLSDKREGEGVISGVRSKCDESDGDGEGSDDSDDKDDEASYKKGYDDGYKVGFEEGFAKGEAAAGGDEEEEEGPDGSVLKPTKAVLTGMADGTVPESAYDGNVKTSVATTTEKKVSSRMLKLWLDGNQKIKSVTLKLWFYDDSCKSDEMSGCLKQWSKLKGVTAAVRFKKADIVCGQVGNYTLPDISKEGENSPAVSVTLECPDGTKGKEIRIYPKDNFGDLLISEVEVRGEDKKLEVQKRDQDLIRWESEFLLENTKFGDKNEPIGWEHGHIYNGL
ncbi:hypothetical protein ACHWQZ_G004161 [Mnemiopsis leidyi]